MVTVKRPQRLFSFSDHQRTQPNQPPPGDRLDAQFMELTEAIKTTQDALAQIRRDDGKLKPHSTLEPSTMQELVDTFATRIAPAALKIAGTAQEAKAAERQAMLYAKDAEAAVAVATQLINGMKALRAMIESKANANDSTEQITAMLTSEAENWANHSEAMADNAIAAKDEALQWAEYLAGPVVNAQDAPAYIAGSKFPNGLYYQPVQGGLAGLWSSKWWALYAYNLVGMLSTYYLGAWPTPPLPGESHPVTGLPVPNPITPGSIYFNSEDDVLYVWNGSEWVRSVSLATGFEARYVYTAATDGQTTFTGPDDEGRSPAVGESPSDVHLNGVRLVENHDYTIDRPSNALTIGGGVPAGAVVQWDLLVAPGDLAPGAVNAWKILPLTPNGTAQDFNLTYVNELSATVPANVTATVQLLVSLDGIVQEPGIDFTASGPTLHMAVAPPSGSHFWAVWYQSAIAP